MCRCYFRLDAITQAPAQHCQNRNRLANHAAHRLHLLSQLPIGVGSDLISPVLVVRDLGIHIDADDSMRSHVMKTKSACFAVLRRLRYLWTVFQSLMSCLVLPRLDYSNTVLAGIPLHLARRLQSVMNAAAGLVFASSKCGHITPLLRKLHWLKVPWRIDYKLAVLVYKCLHGMAPPYLANELHHPAVGVSKLFAFHFVS